MKVLNPIRMSGREVIPLIEGGKGISITNGESSGAWAACGGIGTFSGVNADTHDEHGRIVPQTYSGRTRRDRHEELVAYSIRGGIYQAQIAHDMSNGEGRIHMNVLWEMAACERILQGILDGARGLIHGITCGAGMPYRLGEIAARYGVHYYPIISSARAFRALWKRAYHKFGDWLGAVVYEDPWLAGGHNGLSNSEDPRAPESPFPRILALRQAMNELGLHDTPIVMAGGVWYLREWEDWIDNKDLGPIAFQLGTRPLLTKESPIPEVWKRRLTTLQKGDVFLNRFSPTGFWSSAVNNGFIRELAERNDRQIAYGDEPAGEMTEAFAVGARKREVYVSSSDAARAQAWRAEGHSEALKTPDSTLIFVAPDRAEQIRRDQVDCMGCLSQCKFSNWNQEEDAPARKADPRSYCIQKTLQDVAHTENLESNLMFAGHGAYRFANDPFYSNGFVPSVKQLLSRLLTGN